MKFAKDMLLTITEVRMKGDEHTYTWTLKDDDDEIIKYGVTEDKSHEDLYKGKLVNIDGDKYIVTYAEMKMLDIHTYKTDINLLEVDEEQWVVEFECKMKGGK